MNFSEFNGIKESLLPSDTSSQKESHFDRMFGHGISRNNEDLEENTGNNHIERFTPGQLNIEPPKKFKPDITPVEAFMNASGKDLPKLTILAFAVTAAITGYTWLLPALNKYLSNYDASYNDNVNPYGQNMTISDAEADAKKDANNLNNEFIEGGFTTALIVTMSIFGGIAVASVFFNAVRLVVESYWKKRIDLSHVVSDTTRRQDGVYYSQGTFLWNYYPILQRSDPGPLERGMAKLEKYFYNPLAAGATSSLASALILAVILGYYVKREFNGFYDERYGELVEGGNCKLDDQILACKAQADQHAVDSVINYLFEDVLDNSGVQVLAWIPVVLFVVMVVVNFINRAESGNKMNWISAFIKDSGQDVPRLMVLSFALMLALTGPFALQLGKKSYDANYKQLYDSNLSNSPDTFAASGAADLYAGDYTYGELLTAFIDIQIGLFALMVASVLARSVRSILAHRSGVIDVFKVRTAEERDTAMGQSEENNSEKMFFGPYENNAYNKGSTLRGTFAHRLYTDFDKYTPSIVWRVYYPMVIGVTTTLLVSAVFSVISWYTAQDKFWKYFNEKFNALNDNGNCESSAEDRDCRSNAARDGLIYGLKKMMSMTGRDYVQGMVWLTVGVMGAVYVANGLYNLIDWMGTPAPTNSVTLNDVEGSNFDVRSDDLGFQERNSTDSADEEVVNISPLDVSVSSGSLTSASSDETSKKPSSCCERFFPRSKADDRGQLTAHLSIGRSSSL
jgi:hypothetical protein